MIGVGVEEVATTQVDADLQDMPLVTASGDSQQERPMDSGRQKSQAAGDPCVRDGSGCNRDPACSLRPEAFTRLNHVRRFYQRTGSG